MNSAGTADSESSSAPLFEVHSSGLEEITLSLPLREDTRKSPVRPRGGSLVIGQTAQPGAGWHPGSSRDTKRHRDLPIPEINL